MKLTVTDSGTGIEEENLSQIFDPYFTTKDGADGLGLAIAYSVVKRHRGTIKVHPVPWGGTSFYLYIPAMIETDEKEMTEPAIPAPLSGNERQHRETSDRKGGSILIMDDEKDILEMANRMMNLLGYKVSTARTSGEAVDRYYEFFQQGEPFDAVILDLKLPGAMGGRETFERLMEIDPNVKAIVSSGYSSDPVMTDFERYGFAAAVAKPYTSRELDKVLKKVLGSTETKTKADPARS